MVSDAPNSPFAAYAQQGLTGAKQPCLSAGMTQRSNHRHAEREPATGTATMRAVGIARNEVAHTERIRLQLLLAALGALTVVVVVLITLPHGAG